MFGNLHQVCHGAAGNSGLEDYLFYYSSHVEAQELLGDVIPLCCYC